MTDKERLIELLTYSAFDIADISALHFKIYGVKTSFYYELEGMKNSLKYKKSKLKEEIANERTNQ